MEQEQVPILKYNKIVSHAFEPTKGSLKAAGYDLKSLLNTIVPAKGKATIPTGIKLELPKNCYGRIAPRSGLAVNHFIDVGEIEAKTKITEEYLNRRPLLKYEYKRLVAVCNDPQEMTCNDLKRLAEKSKVPKAVKQVVREKWIYDTYTTSIYTTKHI
ncbi:deoxyuridine 5'-triphosphate nucleotidohydrolase-like [Sitophilus oryzae]|uniref:Deoxyuridine 5'-triphosphate nucleotidohydrolase n=1 Tax=Sitophilus oryzae TaxID=7048 RepID=A0A6J2Y2C7_SITOR|nr:deoxyuridine 5'-triphosphate nucleotidohydrolase-like [Sitophilus oryzae]